MNTNTNDKNLENPQSDLKEQDSASKSLKENETEKKKAISKINAAQFKMKIEYINTHIGMFTLFVTIGVGVLSLIFKGLYYTFMAGKFDYWGIDHSYINILNESLLYEIVLYAAAAVIYAALNLIPFIIINSDAYTCKKIFGMELLILGSSVAISIIMIVNILIQYEAFSIIGTNLTISSFLELILDSAFPVLLLTIIFYSLGIVLSLVYVKAKKESQSRIFLYEFFRKEIIITIIIAIAIYAIVAYISGSRMSEDKEIFKTIGNNYVVIYEDAEHFLVSKCKIEGNKITIDSTKQKLILKESIETTTQKFIDVKREKKNSLPINN